MHSICSITQHLLQRKSLDGTPVDYLYHRFTQLSGDTVLLKTPNRNTNQIDRGRFSGQCATRSHDYCEMRMKEENDDEAQPVRRDLARYWNNIAGIILYPDIVVVDDKPVRLPEYGRVKNKARGRSEHTSIMCFCRVAELSVPSWMLPSSE